MSTNDKDKPPDGYFDKNGKRLPLNYFDDDVDPPDGIPESMRALAEKYAKPKPKPKR